LSGNKYYVIVPKSPKEMNGGDEQTPVKVKVYAKLGQKLKIQAAMDVHFMR
jgi:hypothetical protein